MPTPFEYDRTKATLRVGDRAAYVYRLEQELTYYGVIEGVPTRWLNERHLQPLREEAGTEGTYLIEPRVWTLEETTFMGRLKTFMGHPVELLPMVQVALFLRSDPVERTADYSTLRIFFFQDQFAPPLDDAIAQAISKLDWNRWAVDRNL